MATRELWLGSARAISNVNNAIRRGPIRFIASDIGHTCIHTSAKRSKDGEKAEKIESGMERGDDHTSNWPPIASSSKQTLDPNSNSKSKQKGSKLPLFISRESRSTLKDLNISGQQNSSQEIKSKSRLQRDALDALKESEKIFQQDKILRTLMLELGRHADREQAVHTIDICTKIRHRMEFLEQQSHRKDVLVPPVFVFHMLLKALGSKGELVRCKEVLEDMRACGKEIGLTELEWLLRAAIYASDTEEMDTILSEIVEILNATSPQSYSEEVKEDEGGILSAEYMRNWTPRLYQIMFTHCYLTRNLEYALALLGAAGQRAKEERELSKGRPFLHEIFDLTTVKAVLKVTKDCRQARLMCDLAFWLDEGAAKRKIGFKMWMEVLRCCAEEHWFPGVALAWDQGVRRGLYIPDEGLFMSILHCAARASQPKFIEMLLNAQKGFGPVQKEVREWHLMPLFEAQCRINDFEGALRAATKIAKLAHGIFAKNHLMALVSSSDSSRDVARLAYKAFVTVGRDENEGGGVILHTMNAMIRLASRSGLHEMALKVYGLRKFLADGLKASKNALPMLPTFYLELSANAYQTGETGQEMIRQTITQIQDMEIAHENAISNNNRIIRPDIATFNALLTVAVDTESREMAEFVFRELNSLKIKADETTYERAIVLFVIQPDYSDAISFLEECKSNGMVPTRNSFLFIGLRCLKEKDDRWIKIAKEMLDHGYYPGAELKMALLEGDYVSSARFSSLERAEVQLHLDENYSSPHKKHSYGK